MSIPVVALRARLKSENLGTAIATAVLAGTATSKGLSVHAIPCQIDGTYSIEYILNRRVESSRTPPDREAR